MGQSAKLARTLLSPDVVPLQSAADVAGFCPIIWLTARLPRELADQVRHADAEHRLSDGKGPPAAVLEGKGLRLWVGPAVVCEAAGRKRLMQRVGMTMGRRRRRLGAADLLPVGAVALLKRVAHGYGIARICARRTVGNNIGGDHGEGQDR